MDSLNKLIRRLDKIDTEDSAAASQVDWGETRARMRVWATALAARLRGEIGRANFLRYNQKFDAMRSDRRPETPEEKRRAHWLRVELLGRLDQNRERLRRRDRDIPE